MHVETPIIPVLYTLFPYPHAAFFYKTIIYKIIIHLNKNMKRNFNTLKTFQFTEFQMFCLSFRYSCLAKTYICNYLI